MRRLVLTAALAALAAHGAAAQDYGQSQGWTSSEASVWYESSQGSRLIREDWFRALRRPDGGRFDTRATLEGYGYIYLGAARTSLPAGFVVDVDAATGARYLGLNCAACHTSKLKAGGAEVIIHGGSTLSDFQAFVGDLTAAMDTASADENALMAFAARLPGQKSDPKSLAALRTQLQQWLSFRHSIDDTGRRSHWGRGRADAVGVILATVAAVVADPAAPAARGPSIPQSNAPVSYPFVWNANQQARLQHNGVVDNGEDYGLVKVAKIGALIRNWTEAFGVFADVRLKDDGAIASSIRLDNLLRIEQALSKLESPRWPDSFGALDEARTARGKSLYDANCARCHGRVAPEDTQTFLPLLDQPKPAALAGPEGFIYLQPLFDAQMRPADFDHDLTLPDAFIGTDPGMACNAMMHTAPTGRLAGQINVKGMRAAETDQPFGKIGLSTDLLRVLIQRDVMSHKADNFKMFAENQLEALGSLIVNWAYQPFADYTGQDLVDDKLSPLRAKIQSCVQALNLISAMAPDSPVPVYKARPLNGIWATAPYLHNGSVPTLYDLLKPQGERPASFGVLDGQMDVAKGGLADQRSRAGAFLFSVYDENGKVVNGNWNGGHDYGTALTDPDRYDLVEYLKSL